MLNTKLTLWILGNCKFSQASWGLTMISPNGEIFETGGKAHPEWARENIELLGMNDEEIGPYGMPLEAFIDKGWFRVNPTLGGIEVKEITPSNVERIKRIIQSMSKQNAGSSLFIDTSGGGWVDIPIEMTGRPDFSQLDSVAAGKSPLQEVAATNCNTIKISTMEETGRETWRKGTEFQGDTSQDLFVHFTTPENATKILETNTLGLGEGSTFAVSATYGIPFPEVQTTHIGPDDNLVGIVFSTDAPPKIGYSEEVVWEGNIPIKDAEIIPINEGMALLSEAPTPLHENDEVVYESWIAQNCRFAAKKDPKDLGLYSHEDAGIKFETGQPVEFPYIRMIQDTPFMGEMFQQHIDPAGRYMSYNEDNISETIDTDRIKSEIGTHGFQNPLVLQFNTGEEYGYNEHSWKARLYDYYGKKGKPLARALVKDGYDGIITVRTDKDQPEVSEIVDLKPFIKEQSKKAWLSEVCKFAQNEFEDMFTPDPNAPPKPEEVSRETVSEPFTITLYRGFDVDIAVLEASGYVLDPSQGDQQVLWFSHSLQSPHQTYGMDPKEFAADRGQYLLEYPLEATKTYDLVTFSDGSTRTERPSGMEAPEPTDNQNTYCIGACYELPDGWYFSYKTQKHIITDRPLKIDPSMISEQDLI